MKYIVNLNGKDYEVDVEKGQAIMVDVRDAAPVIAAAPVAAPAAAATAAPAPAAPVAAPIAAAGTPINCPLPGIVVAVKVTVGQVVKEGDVLFVVEAMKMENEIVAPNAGTIAQLCADKGKQLNKGDLLAVIA